MLLNRFSLDFQASYKLDVPSLCVDFQEDIEFHFSLGWQAILRKFLAPHNASLAIALGANVSALIDHFTVVCLVAWPLNEGEAGGDLALIETFLLLLC